MLKNKIGEFIEIRKREINSEYFSEIWDEPAILDVLKQNYDETIFFLKNANYDEIAISSCVLEDLIEIYPTRELLDCFKSRVNEFDEHDKNKNNRKRSIILHVFKESVEEAEAYLSELLI